MPDIAALLKSEITRLSKKAIRQQTNPLRSASTAQRRQLAQLRQQVLALQKEVAALRRGVAADKSAAPKTDEGAKLRFVAKGFKTLRSRLGLSAEETARILGVSGQTVFNWEQGRTRPRADQLSAIAALRKMGKREVKARLAEQASAPKRKQG